MYRVKPLTKKEIRAINSSEFQTRYWAKVDKQGWPKNHPNYHSGGWRWTAALTSQGYGCIGVIGQKTKNTNRIALFIDTQTWPINLGALHTCHVRSCINPSHLYWGTRQENSNDMVDAGRHFNGNQKGENNPSSKLNEDDILYMQKRHEEGITRTQIAKELGVCVSTVSNVFLGKIWQHVTELALTPGIKNGKDHPLSKLTANEVRYVREEVIKGTPRKQLANLLNVSRETINRIVNLKTYTDVV